MQQLSATQLKEWLTASTPAGGSGGAPDPRPPPLLGAVEGMLGGRIAGSPRLQLEQRCNELEVVLDPVIDLVEQCELLLQRPGQIESRRRAGTLAVDRSIGLAPA